MAKRPSKPPAGKLPSWRIVRIAKKGQTLTTLAAADAEAAVRLYIEQHEVIDAMERRRLTAVRVVED